MCRGAFPGGDAFLVYPGPDGVPWESIRYKVFAQAMWDHRALSLLAKLAGREEVLALIDTNGSGGSLAMDSFSYDPFITGGFASWSTRESCSAWVKHRARINLSS
ncbi:conserved hypothetical protein [Arthrobacter sp. Hiyo8]|nr:conserved hypothetical protein [Arthrobacter sp. Hiyo8]